MTTEFNLSDKIQEDHRPLGHIYITDVIEFIRLLKERQCVCIDNKELGIKAKCRLCSDIHELAGDKLEEIKQ